MKKLGRPSDYNPEIAAQICELMMHGYSLRKICSMEEFPEKATVFKWLARHEEFRDQYAQSRAVQAEHIADEIFDITDDESRDVSGELQMPNGVAVQRDRLRVDTRKWYLSKVLPKVYGDKLLHQGDSDNPVEIVVRRIGGKQ